MSDAYEPRQVRKEAAVSKVGLCRERIYSYLSMQEAISDRVRIRMHDQGISYINSLKFTKYRYRDREIIYSQFQSLLSYPQINHFIFTRWGGYSKRPFHELNVSFWVGDREEDVRRNISLIKDISEAKKIISLNQIHSDKIVCIKSEGEDYVKEDGDGIITDIPSIALMIKVADCQSIFMFDPKRGVIGNIHNGWRGAVKNILTKAVHLFVEKFGSSPSDILCYISPSLGPCCAEFRSYSEIFPREFERFKVDKFHFNLWDISEYQLRKEGIPKENIEISRICTRCRPDLFYSFRREGITGRSATLIMLSM